MKTKSGSGFGDDGADQQSRRDAPKSISRARKAKSVACKRCHERKVKCSGGYPCQACSAGGKGQECTFPSRKSKSQFTSRFVQDILRQNEQLKHQISSLSGDRDRQSIPRLHNAPYDVVDANPTDVRPWFINSKITDTPILMAAVADAAYATRLRQIISTPQDSAFAHIPRVHYATDAQITACSNLSAPWPSVTRRRFLVSVALQHVGDRHHIVRRSQVLDDLQRSIDDPNWGDTSQRCNMWAILAIGELYASRSCSGVEFPGLSYYANATRILGQSHERPNLASVETRLLLCLYSLSLNRRYSAYWLSGAAMRIAIVIGLHLHINPSQLGDVPTCEHRKRVFWTAYILDRKCAAMLGHPPAIQDDDIDIALPFTIPQGNPHVDDFVNTDAHLAETSLAAVTTRLVKLIYGKRKTGDEFVERVQRALLQLQAWSQDLPDHLHLEHQMQGSYKYKSISLCLWYYQCYILTTRPVLLHVFRKSVECWPNPPAACDVPSSAKTLSTACICYARKSFKLIMDAWTDGSFATFDFFYTQYMFSSMLIMAISIVLCLDDSSNDEDMFESAAGFLEQLKAAGNFAAQEFSQHIKETQNALAALRVRRAGMTGAEAPSCPATSTMFDMDDSDLLNESLLKSMSSLDYLLNQPYQDWQLLETPIQDSTSVELYWPDLTADNVLSSGQLS